MFYLIHRLSHWNGLLHWHDKIAVPSRVTKLCVCMCVSVCSGRLDRNREIKPWPDSSWHVLPHVSPEDQQWMLEPCLRSALISPCLRATRLHTNRLWRHGVRCQTTVDQHNPTKLCLFLWNDMKHPTTNSLGSRKRQCTGDVCAD